MQWLKFTTERGREGEPLREELVNPARIQSIRYYPNTPEMCEIIFNNFDPAEDFNGSLVVFHTFEEIQQVLRYCGDHVYGFASLAEQARRYHEAQTPNL